MAEGKRPGGLTALAVLNFIFGGLGMLSVLAFAAIVAVVLGTDVVIEDQELATISEAWKAVGTSMFVLVLTLGLVTSVLLILSGIGYIKQKRFLGRTLGTAYGVLGVASTLISATVSPVDQGGGFNIGMIINLIYPVLTLILLNTTFKHDFD